MENNMAKTLLSQRLHTLAEMNKKQLEAYWREIHSHSAPTLPVRILRQHLAWRIQELALGGFTEETRVKLIELQSQQDPKGKIKDKKIVMPPAGTRLQRDHNGERHEVLVLSDGFEYRGKVHKSLSKVARIITGSHWSGPLFFGLRR